MSEHLTTCPICEVACGLRITVEDGDVKEQLDCCNRSVHTACLQQQYDNLDNQCPLFCAGKRFRSISGRPIADKLQRAHIPAASFHGSQPLNVNVFSAGRLIGGVTAKIQVP